MLKKMVSALLLLVMMMSAVAALGEEMTIDEKVDAAFAKVRSVGGAFVVALGDEIVYERYYGVQQQTTKVPVTEKSYFRCASVTKLVTGIGIMKMALWRRSFLW